MKEVRGSDGRGVIWLFSGRFMERERGDAGCCEVAH